ncbi:MAG: hypothetical protein AUJ85_03590 [Elusimicrobia bacterium CG1_02_37_114]|nr:MAG: hypothetical protein AUJ85_03590 [Elusimicrobia bacterium CG1_02_37_114]PIV52952.1 MAG: hypothetical protein COS17_06430 [Elusimicrobia bacterium CG02_land_8_20_14_3_00_37_13]PIZ14205.1 MAG: hypothetical protein COY53_00895 [Elusimicrobia bacterium CG_4_10_14_0_8_um_filter_37_32]
MKNDDFINQYIALVKSIAGKYGSPGIPFDDIVQIEKDILKHFFEEKMPLAEIAKLLGLRRESVRQIKQKALRKIKINTK